ncbi:putative diguanylate cyclase YedQ [Variibacter gotjawalensis]|uniref:diguanylate cyclase n=1 Tax=Variibacter gotjawalensis TaxID=1333996 RepID=A0A0S3PX95_9BRAD|nr:diguanylate cyclase (GGDEF)-like protein [Variibacter gotjawalensis]BAT60515.1 putative diguanylate cyclase YedQ [Variibacter gotjawalensis]
MQNSFLHIQTLTLVTMLLTTLLAVLLMISWWRARSHKILAWWAVSYFLGGTGTLLLALRGSIPNVLSIEVANALVILACGASWCGARSFEGRPVRTGTIIAAALGWIAICQVPLVADSVPVRIVIMSAVMSTFIALGASEFWRGRSEHLVSRWPAIVASLVYAAALLSRIPMLQFVDLPTAPLLFRGSSWFGLVSVVSLIYIVVMGCNVLAMAKERMELSYRHKSRTDSLTQLFTRRAFLDESEAVLQEINRSGTTAAVILIDLDSFKRINDCFGHLVGDSVLQRFAATARKMLRDIDIVGRLGGEEFAIVLPGLSPHEATVVAEQLRFMFQREAIEVEGELVGATLSAGVSFAARNAKLITLLADADRALYVAKEAGRNCVRVASVDVIIEAPPVTQPRAA